MDRMLWTRLLFIFNRHPISQAASRRTDEPTIVGYFPNIFREQIEEQLGNRMPENTVENRIISRTKSLKGKDGRL